MNKYISDYTTKINESIGQGSVLLIKGAPFDNGRYLYVTTIQGYTEIRPGLKMMFLGNQVYRVVHRDNKFFGKKIDYRGEEGLKGMFNMRNAGKPSIVLNHNKTPYHWLTLKHTDIGSALREIGPGIFDHSLILESKRNDSHQIDAHNYLIEQFLNLSFGKDSILTMEEFNVEDENFDDAVIDSEDKTLSHEWSVENKVSINADLIEDENAMIALENEGLVNPYTDMLSISENIEIVINFESDVSLSMGYYDAGDYVTPPEVEDNEVDDIDNNVSSIFINGIELLKDDFSEDVKSQMKIYDSYLDGKIPYDLKFDIKSKIGNDLYKGDVISRNSSYEYHKEISRLKHTELTAEDKKKWSNIYNLKEGALLKAFDESFNKIKEVNDKIGPEIDNNTNDELWRERDNAYLYLNSFKDLYGDHNVKLVNRLGTYQLNNSIVAKVRQVISSIDDGHGGKDSFVKNLLRKEAKHARSNRLNKRLGSEGKITSEGKYLDAVRNLENPE